MQTQFFRIDMALRSDDAGGGRMERLVNPQISQQAEIPTDGEWTQPIDQYRARANKDDSGSATQRA